MGGTGRFVPAATVTVEMSCGRSLAAGAAPCAKAPHLSCTAPPNICDAHSFDVASFPAARLAKLAGRVVPAGIPKFVLQGDLAATGPGRFALHSAGTLQQNDGPGLPPDASSHYLGALPFLL
ncbi:unnamed protein product [Phytophthora lilii]|uniref:Unnamed protein product n=1 Tax=Phytophthora lilii TaxID=2077276 RepID=A0A9W6XC88_9STRA|nr:unnamed protein product [Phytophthora lilii]